MEMARQDLIHEHKIILVTFNMLEKNYKRVKNDIAINYNDFK